MAKKKLVPPPPYVKAPAPASNDRGGDRINAGTQVGEREYNPNSVTRYNADQFLKNQATAGSMITPSFKEMRYLMDWLQQFVNVNRDEYNTNPFSELKANPLMAQLNAGINPYIGTRGYIPPTASSRGAPPPQVPLPIPIPGPMPPGNKIPPFMPPPRLPDPRLPQPPMPSRPSMPNGPSMPSPKIPPSPKPMPLPPMPPSPKPDLPPSFGTPRTVPDANAAAKNAAAAAQASPKKLAPKPKQVKPTLNSYIPRYERD